MFPKMSFLFILVLSPIFLLSAENQYTATEMKILKANPNLRDVQKINPDILVELKYSSSDNFLKQDLYGDYNKCFLQKEASIMLSKSQKYLSKLQPGYKLKVFDGLRPRSIQFKMWKAVKGTPQQRYVANPYYGSIHNYGCAVDLTIVNEKGEDLDMGTAFDYFGPLAEPRYEKKFLKAKKLTQEQVNNRKLLRKVMYHTGFRNIYIEWWHFNAFPKDIVKMKYNIVE